MVCRRAMGWKPLSTKRNSNNTHGIIMTVSGVLIAKRAELPPGRLLDARYGYCDGCGSLVGLLRGNCSSMTRRSHFPFCTMGLMSVLSKADSGCSHEAWWWIKH